MDDRDVVDLYIAEMRAILPLVQRHISTFGGEALPDERSLAQRETVRLATAMADLSSGFHAEDCAQLSNALARAFDAGLVGPAQVRLAAAAADVVSYLQLRMTMMSGQSRILAPDDTGRAWCHRLLATVEGAGRPMPAPTAAPITRPLPIPLALSSAEAPHPVEASPPAPFGYIERVTRPIPDPLALESDPASDEGAASASGGSLTADELALVRSFHSSRLRRSPGAEHAPPPRSPNGDPAVSAPSQLPAGPDPDAHAHPPTDEELDAIPADMKRIFVGETGDDLKALRQALLSHEEYPEDGEPLLTMSRLTHKIRGAASTLGFGVLAQLAFIYEDLLRALLSKQVPADTRSSAALLQCLLLLQEALAAAQAEREPDQALMTQAEAIRNELHAGRVPMSDSALPLFSPVGARPAPAVSPESPGATRPPAIEEFESSLRVDVRRLDDLMTHISDLALSRAALAQARADALQAQDEMDRSLARLAEISVDIGDAASYAGRKPQGVQDTGASAGGRNGGSGNSSNGNGAASHTGWDELELTRYDEFDHALRVLGEVVADLTTTSRALRSTLTRLARISQEQAGVATEMQQDVMRIRLVPLKDMVPRLQVETRGLAAQLGKQITLSVRGEMTQIDRNVSDALSRPLIQLVRNAAVHATETPSERRDCGKPEMGSIWLHASYVGSEVIIEIGDDGRGINPHSLAASAVAVGILDPAAARELSQADALDLMFLRGVTTYHTRQMQAGSGMGLDDVRNVIETLKGSIHVQSTPGQGTVFRIRVPISLSIVRALLVQSAEQHYAIPFSSVLRTLTLAHGDVLTTDAQVNGSPEQPGAPRRRIRIQKTGDGSSAGSAGIEEIPLIPLAELLGREHVWRDQEVALVVDLGRGRVALIVESVYGDQEVVVKALPRHLRRRAVRGATVTPDGEVLLLLDVPALAPNILDGGALPMVRRSRPAPEQTRTLAPRVLIVDDSISIRRSLEAALTRAGFEVQCAQDGIEALDTMLTGLPRVVILDIEMPRLDGFELLSIVRDSPQFGSVRVAMLTSRASEKHREHALRLGASAYLVKPCPNETLIETVHSLIAEPARVP